MPERENKVSGRSTAIGGGEQLRSGEAGRQRNVWSTCASQASIVEVGVADVGIVHVGITDVGNLL